MSYNKGKDVKLKKRFETTIMNDINLIPAWIKAGGDVTVDDSSL